MIKAAVRVATLTGAAAAITLAAACDSTYPATAAAATPTASSAQQLTLKACRDLAAWERGGATNTIANDPAEAQISTEASGTQFGKDFDTWVSDLGDITADQRTRAQDADQVGIDCQNAGQPDVLNGGTPLSENG